MKTMLNVVATRQHTDRHATASRRRFLKSGAAIGAALASSALAGAELAEGSALTDM